MMIHAVHCGCILPFPSTMLHSNTLIKLVQNLLSMARVIDRQSWHICIGLCCMLSCLAYLLSDCSTDTYSLANTQDLAQRAMTAYLRSVFLQPNRAVFDASVLPLEDYALSLGLSTVPRLRFLARDKKGASAKGLADAGSSQVCPQSFARAVLLKF